MSRVENKRDTNIEFDLRKEKKDVLRTVIEHLHKKRAGFIKVPTGWGKTFLAKHLMNHYRNNGHNVLFMVYSNNALLQQTFEGKKSHLCPADILLYGGKKKPEKEQIEGLLKKGHGSLIAISVNTLLHESNQEYRDTLLAHSNLLVVDEIHNFIYNKGNDIIEQAFESGSQIFGMTATPMQGIIDRLKFVWEILPELEEIWSKNLTQCILDGDLSGLDYFTLKSQYDIRDVLGGTSLQKALDRMQDITIDIESIEQIDRLIHRSQLAYDAYKRFMKNEKALVFCAPTQRTIMKDKTERVDAFHSKMTAAVFNQEIRGRVPLDFGFENFEDGKPKETCFLSSDLKKAEREKIINCFKSPDSNPRVLCTINMLVEGFDFPNLKQMILLRPTLSPRLFIQQLGRVLRKSQNGNKARVIEIVDDTSSIYELVEWDKIEASGGMTRVQSLLSLNPVERIANVITEGSDFRVVKNNQVSLYEIVIREGTDGWSIEGRQLVSIKTRIDMLQQILKHIRAIYEGKATVSRYRVTLFAVLSGLSMLSVEDAKQVRDIVRQLENEIRVTEEQIQSGFVSTNASKPKLLMLQAAKWYTLCRALSSITPDTSILTEEERIQCISILEFPSDVTTPQDGLFFCLRMGKEIEGVSALKKHVGKLIKNVEGFTRFEKIGWVSRRTHRSLFRKFIRKHSEELLWVDCFKNDSDIFLLIEKLKKKFREGGLKTKIMIN